MNSYNVCFYRQMSHVVLLLNENGKPLSAICCQRLPVCCYVCYTDKEMWCSLAMRRRLRIA